MSDLNKKAIAGFLQLIFTLAALLFLPAWTLDYWQAWLFLSVFSVCILATTIYLMKHDPRLLERRMRSGPGAEKQRSQKVIQVLSSVAFTALFIFCALDHRFGWSTVSPYVVVVGDTLAALGLLIVFFVFRENSFTSAIIDVAPGQKIVCTGPYALVRHPMYAGALVMLSGIPLALGSWWGLLTVIPIAIVIVWRLIEEERFLETHLPGYSEYRSKVRHRLVPYIW
jgi:protein-S-isoprenylcysteine O-methyltransferase Ste14